MWCCGDIPQNIQDLGSHSVSTQLPSTINIKILQNKDHRTLNRGTLGGLARSEHVVKPRKVEDR